MEIIWIIGLAILTVVILTLYIRERKAVNSYKKSEDSSERQIKDLKNQVFHHKHHSEMHQKSFTESELKIKEMGFSGVEDPQLMDSDTIQKISKVRASMEEGAKKRSQRKKAEEIAAQVLEQARIKKLADAERARLAVIASKETASRMAKRYRDQGSYSTDSSGILSFIPVAGAISYDGGDFSGSGGSFGDSGSGGSFSSSDSGGGDSGGGGGGGGD